MTWRLHDGVREAEAQESEIIAAIAGGTLPASTRIRRSDEAEWRALRTHVPFAVALERLREAAPAPQPEPSTEARTPIGHVPYDAEVIRAFAERLYRDAGSMVVSNPIAGGFVGLLFGAIGGHFIGQEGLTAVTGGVVLALLAYVSASRRAAALRLQAQLALCQVQIEANTRVRR